MQVLHAATHRAWVSILPRGLTPSVVVAKRRSTKSGPIMNDRILVLNSGSSSIKFALFGDASAVSLLLQGAITGLDGSTSFAARDASANPLTGKLPASNVDHESALAWLIEWLQPHVNGAITAAGHRVVHGGEHFGEPVLFTAQVYADLETLTPLAPLHQPHNLAAVRALTTLLPDLPQVACFDTAYHRTQDARARHFALPRTLSAAGVKRYGFHGLSYEYIASVLPQFLGTTAEERVIVAHLGNGASLCAMHNRKCVATTMGFTALDGLIMGTRCGALDPGVLLYLMREKAMTVDDIEDLLYRHSGLLGVSGISSDMRQLLASSAPEAGEAVDLFCYRAAREIGSLAAALGGLDALVFTAGIGEHAPEVRARICGQLAWLGVTLDDAANASGNTAIGSNPSRVGVWVIPTNEEAVIARHTARVAGLR
jgi:acetate kinase